QFKLYVFGTTSSQVTITEQPRTDFVLASLTCSSTLNGVPQTDTSVNLATATATIVPAEGEEISCTYVNQQALTLTVIKQVINAYEGTAGPSAFTLRVTGSNGISSALPGSATGTPYPVLPGTYTVTEEGPLDIYRLVGFSGDCDASGTVTLAPGDAKTCIVTNADIPKSNPTVDTNMRWVLNDSLTLTGWRPGGSGGTVTFKLYGPGDAQCLASVINGTAGSGEVRPLQSGSAATVAGFNLQEGQLANLRGTFRWIAEYSGDTYNDPAATKCGDEAHTIVVHDPAAYLLAQFLTPVNGATDVNISQPIQW